MHFNKCWNKVYNEKLILNINASKSQEIRFIFFPLSLPTWLSKGAPAHKANKPLERSVCTHAYTDPQNFCPNPRERLSRSPGTWTSCYNQVLIWHANCRVGKPRLPKALVKEQIWNTKSVRKPLSSSLRYSITRHLLWSKARNGDLAFTPRAD